MAAQLYFAAVVTNFFFPLLFSVVADWMCTILRCTMWPWGESRMQV